MTTVALRTLYSRRNLLLAWTLRTIRARYQQSILGGLWAVLQPLASVAILTVVFSFFIGVDTGDVPYVIFSYSAMVPWLLFSTSVNDMVESVVSNMNLVGKIYFPREILVIAAMLARLVDFFIAYGVLVIMMVVFQMPVFTLNWLILPAVLMTQLALSLGLGLVAAALNVFYRDIKHLIVLVLQLWFYATPIIYPVSMVPEQFRPFYYLNPMVGVIETYRAVLIFGAGPGPYFIFSVLIALIVLLIGYWFFKQVEYKFADII